MLFPFAAGIHSAFIKERGGVPNCLIQEGIAGGIRKLFGVNDTAAAIARIKGSGVLPVSRLGRAMYKNPKAMDQAFRLYGSKSKTIKKTLPTAFGKVK
jgi:hypothetical protein